MPLFSGPLGLICDTCRRWVWAWRLHRIDWQTGCSQLIQSVNTANQSVSVGFLFGALNYEQQKNQYEQ
jgi:hypothetical protein